MYLYWFSQMNKKHHRPLLLALISLVVVFIFIMRSLNAPLINEIAPAGIVSFELAGSLSAAKQIIGSWDIVATSYAGLNLGIDYLFLIIYSATIALACFMLASGLKPQSRWQKIGYILVTAQWLAALADMIENYGLIRLFLGSNESLWAGLAYYAAIIKFVLIILALIYLLLTSFLRIIQVKA